MCECNFFVIEKSKHIVTKGKYIKNYQEYCQVKGQSDIGQLTLAGIIRLIFYIEINSFMTK